MSRTPVAILVVAGFAFSTVTARAQAVVSVRSGVVHYIDGAVSLNGQPLESHLGKFPSIPDGGELRTGQAGKAEVLLTPGVFLRMGQNSGIRLLASALSGTRVELLSGAAIVDSREKGDAAPVTLIYRDWMIRQLDKGVYRVDADPPRIQAMEGEAQVLAGGPPVKVAQGMELPLKHAQVAAQPASDAHDALNDWEQGRAEAISADNAIAANIEDPASMPGVDLGLDGFTYFPLLPFPSTATSIGPVYGGAGYGYAGVSAPVLQPGFFAIYLPGYTRRPLGLPVGVGISGLGLSGLHRPVHGPYLPYTPPGTRVGVGVPVGIGAGGALPHAPLSHPTVAAPAHPAGVGVHAIHHR